MCPELSEQSPWAKHMLDRSFELFDRWTERRRGLPPANAFDVPAIDDNESSALLTAARVQANAAQAALFGLGEMQGERGAAAVRLRPRRRPPRGHHARLQHRDRGRHARRVPVRRDRARAAVRPRAGRRGRRRRAPAGLVRRRRARRRGRSPTPRSARWRRPTTQPLRLLEAPRGATANPQNYPNRPYAGAFETLRVQGSSTRGGIEIRTTHTFKAAYIETEWRVSGAKGKQIEVLFPSWGKAKVTAVMKLRRAQARDERDGALERRPLPRRERALGLRGACCATARRARRR